MATAPSVNFLAPGTEAGLDYSQVQRQREMAKMLMQSAFNPQQGQMVGNIYVAPSKFGYLSQMAQALASGAMNRSADDREKSIIQQAQQQRATEAQNFMGALNGTPAKTIAPLTPNDDEGNPMPSAQTQGTAPDRARALAIALQSQNPALQSMGGELMKRQLDERQISDLVSKYGGGGATTSGLIPTGQGGTPSGATAMGGVNPLAFALTGSGFDKLGTMVQDASKPNWMNVNGNLVNTNAPNFQGGIQDGVFAGPDGRVTMIRGNGGNPVTGAVDGSLATYKAFEDAKNQSNAAFTPGRPTILPGGRMGGQSQLEEIGAAPPRVAPLPGAHQPGMFRGSFSGTPESIMSSIDALPEPARSQARQAYSNQLSGNNPAFDPMGSGAQAPLPGAGAGRGSQGMLSVPGGGLEFSPEEKTHAAANNAFNEKQAALQAEMLDASYKTASAAADTLLSVQQARQSMASGAYQGTGAEAKLAAAKFANNVLGLSLDATKVANTDYLKSTLGEGLLQQAKTLGTNPSNADANRINDIVGSIGKDPQAMSKILDWRQEMAERAIASHNIKVDQVVSGGFKPQFDMKVRSPTAAARSPAGPVGLPPGWSVKVK